MEVILLTNVKKLGQLGEKIIVKDGYARNYLIPQKLALAATEKNLKVFEERKAKIAEEYNKKLNDAKQLAEKLSQVDTIILHRQNEEGRLYGTIRSIDIAKELADKHKINVDKNKIKLPSSIKEIGDYKFTIEIHNEVEVEMNLNVTRKEA